MKRIIKSESQINQLTKSQQKGYKSASYFVKKYAKAMKELAK